MSLNARDVHIWHIQLEAEPRYVDVCRSVLSADEVQRADSFHFEIDRRRFIVAHGAVRKILSDYVNIAPPEIVFSYGPKGKPELSPASQTAGITFNLSHSHELALFALARDLSIGIDVEFINRDVACDEIAERFFSAKEIDTLRSLACGENVAGFFSCWTRKEAYIKASGEGLAVPLDSFDVAFSPSVSPALLRVEPPGDLSKWSMYDIAVAREYKAALVVEGKGHRLVGFSFSEKCAAPHSG